MDIRTMQYYLAVVREGTISAAAEALHVAQPSLSRQMKELEKELGAELFVRGNRRITLTEEGVVLRKRAEEMVRLLQVTRRRSPGSRTMCPARYGSGPANPGRSIICPVRRRTWRPSIRISAFISPAAIPRI